MSKKKTHEEYVAELTIKNPNIKVVGKYIDAKTSITHHCLKHDIYWDTTPSRALRGVGCEKCRKEKFRQVRCKSHNQYLKDLFEINPDIVVLEEYIDAKTPIGFYCKKHNISWSAYPDNLLKGCGCIECGKEKMQYKNTRTHEEYVNEVGRVNPNIEVVGNYNKVYLKTLHRCKIDGYEWMAFPYNILSGKGCPKCAGNAKMTRNEYIFRITEANLNIVPLEEFVDTKTQILHKCLIDGHVWSVMPSSILHGYGCPKCAGNAKKTQVEYENDLNGYNPDIEVLGKYINAKTPILHRCKLDGHEWLSTPSNILSGNGCPQCNETKGERVIRQWLESHDVSYVFQKTFNNCRDVKVLSFDFYIESINLCIEYDGKQHFEPVDFAGYGKDFALKQFKYIQRHDDIKNKYCKDNNISLLRIPYYKNIKEELENFLFI